MPIPTASSERVLAGGEDAPQEGDREVMAGGNKTDSKARGGGRFERVTVNLAPAASGALEHAAALTGDSKTDTINRALQIYAMLADAVDRGAAVLVRYADGELERQRFFAERFDRVSTQTN